MKKAGQIQQYKRNKGYTLLPHEFLKDSSISYGARGLLAELQTYPADKKIFKTELYTKREKNKRSSIERIWKELEEAGYLIQFRKRDGKKWDYQYIFSLEKFTEEEKESIGQELSSIGYDLYLCK